MPIPKIIQDIRSLRDRVVRDIEALTRKSLTLETSVTRIQDTNLVGSYYVPKVIRVSNDEPTAIEANPLPTNWTGSGTSYSNGNYQIESSFSMSNANPLSNAFNGNTSDYCRGMVSDVATITITLPEAIEIESFKTYIYPVSPALDIIIVQGSNNKTSWTTLHSNYGTDTDIRYKSLETTGSYKYYRFVFNMESAGEVQVNEIQLGRYNVLYYNNQFEVEGIPSPLNTNQRIFIKTPSFSTVGVTANTFNGEVVDVLMQPDRYYELIYNGTSYIAKEVI